MYIELNNEKFYINGDFETRLSKLRKKSKLEVTFNLYLPPEGMGHYKDILEDLEYFQSLKELPDLIYFTNSYYWWIFEGVHLHKILVREDKDYVSTVSNYYQKRKGQKRFVVEIEFSYKEVFGTNNRKIFDRDLLLRSILN